MDMPEMITVLKTINTYYRRQMDETQIKQSAAVMLEILTPWDQRLIHKAWLKYAGDGNEFPPNPGQLIALAKEIRRTEWEEQKRRTDLLPEPELKREPCPPEIMAKMQNLFKMPI